ncbi:hypothetical protein AAVH_26709 [Aphelenchoides avenae]|nr:hypothetical protein AAVH_26709 [Aphelenchus avenae]
MFQSQISTSPGSAQRAWDVRSSSAPETRETLVFCHYNRRPTQGTPPYQTGMPCKVDRDCNFYLQSACEPSTGLCTR